MGCCREGKSDKSDCLCPNEQVIQGLKAKLVFQSCDLVCSPITKCDCNKMIDDIQKAEDWIRSLPGLLEECSDG